MNALDELAETFAKIPGVGKKSATRIANHLLKADQSFNDKLSSQIASLKTKVRLCRVCGAWAEEEVCPICADPSRDKKTICVVEQPRDVQTIEGSHEYSGVFHVLGGVIAPLEGMTPDKLRIAELLERVKEGGVEEVILATNPTVEGDATALYVLKQLEGTGVAVTRIATGLPAGGDLEYADRLTLARSLRGRTKL